MAHWLYLPDDAVEDLTVLASLSAEQVGKLRDHFAANEFSPRYSYYTKVADLIGMSDDAAAGICGLVNHVQLQWVRLGQEATSIPDEFLQFLKRHPKKRDSQDEFARIAKFVVDNKKPIISLFSDSTDRGYSNKVRGLESGPLPHLHSFRTLCDLRPVYNREATEIVEYLPLVTLSMTIHRNVSDEFEEVAVLLTEEDIADIRETLGRLDKKLAILKQRHRLTDTKNVEG